MKLHSVFDSRCSILDLTSSTFCKSSAILLKLSNYWLLIDLWVFVDARQPGEENAFAGMVAKATKLLGNSSYGLQFMDRLKLTWRHPDDLSLYVLICPIYESHRNFSLQVHFFFGYHSRYEILINSSPSINNRLNISSMEYNFTRTKNFRRSSFYFFLVPRLISSSVRLSLAF